MERIHRFWRYAATIVGSAVLFQTTGCLIDTQALTSTFSTALNTALQSWVTTLLTP
jgi:hypothetical protein